MPSGQVATGRARRVIIIIIIIMKLETSCHEHRRGKRISDSDPQKCENSAICTNCWSLKTRGRPTEIAGHENDGYEKTGMKMHEHEGVSQPMAKALSWD